MKRIWIILIAVAVVAAGGAYHFWSKSGGSAANGPYQFATVLRGNLQDVITSTGTVEPIETIDVGAQVGGLILELGKDPNDPTKTVDFNTRVVKDQVLAKIDPALYQSDVDSSQAQYDSSAANVQQAEANVLQYKAKLDQATNDWERAKTIGTESGALSKSEYDSYQSAFTSAQASVAIGNAAVKQAQANLAVADASLQRAKRNLNYCIILSPVTGVVIDRRVSVGQTVVSSYSAPSLFLIATDLTKMQVWVAVNEAEVGKIAPGMAVNFRVDAFPGEIFQGTVDKVRLNAASSQNVVNYTVEVNADNSEGKLLPYLTANVQFLVRQADNVLYVPNAALRWTPDDEGAGADQSAQGNGNGGGQRGGGRGRNGGGGGGRRRAETGTVWIVDNDGKPKSIAVTLGINDGVFTEIKDGGLKEGDKIIAGDYVADSNEPAMNNPFAPQVFRGGGRGGFGGGGGGGGGGRRGN